MIELSEFGGKGTCRGRQNPPQAQNVEVFLFIYFHFIFMLARNVGKKNIQAKVYRINSFSIKRKC